MELEALENERFEADSVMAEMALAGNVIARTRKAGRCAHQGAAGYMPGATRPQQAGLKPGQSRCTDGCGAVFASDQDWYDAMDAAVESS